MIEGVKTVVYIKTMLPDKPFYLIRHAESEANAASLAAGGEMDSPLSARGKEQAIALAPYLETIKPQPVRIYHSPMTRVKQTATLIADRLNLDFLEYEDLREHRLGDWNGVPWPEILPKLEAREEPPNGETEEVFTKRVRSVFKDILEHCDDGIPLIVAHGGVFHALGYIYKYAMTPIQNCHLHYFEPYPENADFPWRSWHYDLAGDGVYRKSAPFCPTSTDEKIDRSQSFAKMVESTRAALKESS